MENTEMWKTLGPKEHQDTDNTYLYYTRTWTIQKPEQHQDLKNNRTRTTAGREQDQGLENTGTVTPTYIWT
jgi:hypothetical protein